MIALELVQADKAKLTRQWLIEPQPYCRRRALCPRLESSGQSRKSVCVDCNTRLANTHNCCPITKRKWRSFLSGAGGGVTARSKTASGNSEIQRRLTHFIASHREVSRSGGSKGRCLQRLINVYNSDPSGLAAAVDEFLATNPTNERADQAKLLKAEALYKQQNYTEQP